MCDCKRSSRPTLHIHVNTAAAKPPPTAVALPKERRVSAARVSPPTFTKRGSYLRPRHVVPYDHGDDAQPRETRCNAGHWPGRHLLRILLLLHLAVDEAR